MCLGLWKKPRTGLGKEKLQIAMFRYFHNNEKDLKGPGDYAGRCTGVRRALISVPFRNHCSSSKREGVKAAIRELIRKESVGCSRKVEVSLFDFISEEMRDLFENGNICVMSDVSAGVVKFRHSTLCCLPSGKLILCLDTDLYQQLGLVGRPLCDRNGWYGMYLQSHHFGFVDSHLNLLEYAVLQTCFVVCSS